MELALRFSMMDSTSTRIICDPAELPRLSVGMSEESELGGPTGLDFAVVGASARGVGVCGTTAGKVVSPGISSGDCGGCEARSCESSRDPSFSKAGAEARDSSTVASGADASGMAVAGC